MSPPSNRSQLLPATQQPDIAVLTDWMNEIRQSMQAIAVLNERHTNNERRLEDHEERMTEGLSRVEKQVSKVSTELHDFIQAQRLETSTQISKAVDPLWDKQDKNAKLISETKAELDGWINRAKGGWFIASICLGVFQACVVAVLLWAVSEVKTLHDWRISQEAIAQSESRRKQ